MSTYCWATAYTVNSLTDSGTGAGTSGDLRYCITQANTAAGPHTITFTVSGTITLTGVLPVFTRQISVTATPGTIALNGNSLQWVFLFNNTGAANSVLDGLVMNRANINYSNIEINGVNSITVKNCYIGTDATGNAAASSNPNFGINLIGASSNTILNNVISGHAVHGILINSISSGNIIKGNKIGCNLLGTAAIANTFEGIEINNGSLNTIIGGLAAADRNIISGNGGIGITSLNGSNGTQIINNYIGTNLAGTAALPNSNHGIMINASTGAVVTNNLISGNGYFGLYLTNTATSATVQGNKIGVNAAGTGAIANANVGLKVENTNTVTIGGSTAGQGNTISGNGQEGIFMFTCNSAVIKGNFLGTNSTGTAAIANTLNGIHLQTCLNPIIGGSAAGEGNVVSGNIADGMLLEGGTTGASILGNFVGTNASGTAVISNQGNGIAGYNNASTHTIGGNTAGARNIISGNNLDGIHYDGITAACTNLTIQGNYIGTNASGAGAPSTFGNGQSGIVVVNGCTSLLIGGTTTAQQNIVSGNGRLWNGSSGNGTGILIGPNCPGASITGNYVGLAADGSTATGNFENGIVILYSNNITIGGNTAALRNLVSSNGKQGIVLSADPGNEMSGTLIIGNYCGTDATGTLARGNGQSGLISIFASNGFIGRANTNEGNIFSNNSEEGIHLIGGSNNLVYNNIIGTALDKTTAMGNKSGGIFIQGVGGAPNGNSNIIGGLAALQSNVIAYTTNTGANPSLGNGFGIGVAVTDNSQGIQNTFIGNKIFCNAGLGIDLDFTGAFGGSGNNNPGNNSKSAPAITAVTSTSTTGTGTNGETIHVYSNVICTTCQGETYLGSTTVTAGVWTVNHAVVAIPSNNSATATNATQGTSQFTCNFPLPVELLYFKAKVQGQTALLSWATAMEKNNGQFVIERSQDGTHFETIGNKAGQGNSLQVTNYEYVDEQPFPGISYYRLKQIDYDGATTYSSIQSVSFQNSDDFYLFPNPARDEINLIVSNDEPYTIKVYSNIGVEVQHLSVTKANNTCTIHLNGVAPGSYLLEWNGFTQQITKSFLVY